MPLTLYVSRLTAYVTLCNPLHKCVCVESVKAARLQNGLCTHILRSVKKIRDVNVIRLLVNVSHGLMSDPIILPLVPSLFPK